MQLQRTIFYEHMNDKFHLIGCYVQPIAYMVHLSKQRMNLVKRVREVGLEVVPLYKAEAPSNTLHHFKILFWNFDRQMGMLVRRTHNLCLIVITALSLRVHIVIIVCKVYVAMDG